MHAPGLLLRRKSNQCGGASSFAPEPECSEAAGSEELRDSRGAVARRASQGRSAVQQRISRLPPASGYAPTRIRDLGQSVNAKKSGWRRWWREKTKKLPAAHTGGINPGQPSQTWQQELSRVRPAPFLQETAQGQPVNTSGEVAGGAAACENQAQTHPAAHTGKENPCQPKEKLTSGATFGKRF